LRKKLIDIFRLSLEIHKLQQREEEAVVSSSETGNPHRCEECGMSFKSQQELQEHNNEEHVGTA
jgi:uncharacterized C2H2 Zn-finger protein